MTILATRPSADFAILVVMASPSSISSCTPGHIGGEVILPSTMASPPMQASRQWCFTHFGDNEPRWDEGSMKYLVFQKEKAKTTDKLHWQGYVILKQPTKFKQVQTLLDCKGAHMEVSKATNAKAASDYCQKSDTRVSEPKVFGTLVVAPGKRTDLLQVSKLIKEGKSAVQIFDECPDTYIKFHRGISKAIELKDKQIEDRNVVVTVYWGKSGSGKSRRVRDENPHAYWKPPGSWWDRYEGNETVVLDDFDDKQMTRAEFLRLTDRYPYILPVKGGTCFMKATKIFITSNYDPKKWFGGDDAVLRRLTHVVKLDSTPPFVQGDPPFGEGSPGRTPLSECPPSENECAVFEEGTQKICDWEMDWLLSL